ncbi:MAG: HAD-IA family hydrolase [Rubrivivax sp.]
MKTTARPGIEAVLFDLDGTLVDSAPDLAGAVNELRVVRGLVELPFERLRPLVGSGARGMVGAAFGIGPGDAGFALLRDEFLLYYERRLLKLTVVFENIPLVLSALEAARLPWGIVTNKATRFSKPLTAGIAALHGSAALVSGDTTPHAKPHPAPLLEAARQLGVQAQKCVYVGDDLRDVQAARAAGMAAVVAAWGYLGEDAAIATWHADAVVERPLDLLIWLGMA